MNALVSQSGDVIRRRVGIDDNRVEFFESDMPVKCSLREL